MRSADENAKALRTELRRMTNLPRGCSRRNFGKKRWQGEPSISLEAARAAAGLKTELEAYSFAPQYFHLDFRDGMNTGKGGTIVRCAHGADCTRGCGCREGSRNPDNVRCPACGHTWLTFFDDDFFNCVQCGRIRFECPQCRTQSEASRNYCRYCLSGCYDRTIVISLVVQQLQDCSGLLVKCVTLGGEEILVTTLVEEDTVGDFRPKAVEAVLAACGFKQGEDGEFCPDEQLREWERWHDVYSRVRPRHAQREPAVQVVLLASGQPLNDVLQLSSLVSSVDFDKALPALGCS